MCIYAYTCVHTFIIMHMPTYMHIIMHAHAYICAHTDTDTHIDTQINKKQILGCSCCFHGHVYSAKLRYMHITQVLWGGAGKFSWGGTNALQRTEHTLWMIVWAPIATMYLSETRPVWHFVPMVMQGSYKYV